MLKYETIIDSLNEKFPELLQIEECKTIIEYADDLAHLPYLYFPAFWKLLELTLLDKIDNQFLLDRIFSFMEDMAKSEDATVANLMQIEMLEPLFGLEYDLYNKVVKRYLLPETLKLHLAHIPYFKVPQLPAGFKNTYDSSLDKKRKRRDKH